ncbi:uncharacterized protein J4E88_000916 [Alternaria novae-zelandiae]|uniref:uncharacterized protein n=1 Tax=Alternaria novae-zelandiae TaxID=430562 RepID=UPI0020C4EADE|nr:uncharacterized protein J4E88_000916 [Alternaria novae-zelandiae]KAI4696738.1 hypothetical protein J4E88_000916 [Alternaria novae-zelandiae]
MDRSSKVNKCLSMRGDRTVSIDPALPTQDSGQMDGNDELLKTKTKRYKLKFSCACSRFKRFLESYRPSSATTCDAPSLSHMLRRSFTPAKKNENFRRKVDVSLWDKDRKEWSKANIGVALVDTQCQYNLITPQFLEMFGLSPSPSTEPIMIALSNNTEVPCLGEVRARWWCNDSRKVPNFRPKYETSTFYVVDLEIFQLVIGSDTIVELGLLQGNRAFFGAFMTSPPRVDSAKIAQKQREAEERRKKEREEKRKYEQQQKQAAAARKP